MQEYHAKAAANGSAPGNFSFDVNGRSTLLPIPAALQTRLIRQGTGVLEPRQAVPWQRLLASLAAGWTGTACTSDASSSCVRAWALSGRV